MKLLVWNLCERLRFVFKKKYLVLAVPAELEMGLPGHHLVEITSTQKM